MFELPTNKEYLIGPASLAILSTILMLFGLGPHLDFDRNAIADGEIWRILSGQFTHSNWYHLMLNLLGILFIWLLHAEYTTLRKYWLNVLFLGLFTGLMILLFSPNIVVYTGLSGLLHGLIVWGALEDIKRKLTTGYLLFIGVWAKICWEQYAGASTDVAKLIDSRVAIEAHLFGAVGGVVLAVIYLFYKTKKPA
ncbi:rhombosortase [Pseudoalteromonas sp. OF7H-1]|uniref:rhombosortase n=1 Tax=Pseudoalteromonas sp. OF7H-1 TaxID=2917755 RepID=UPI001EF680F0|nr:rhombosortase [Pseudoalteromonas sp. OF7H-1]MCG7539780.1 rhombosortase [Pseudoalteromonas sp. OF7H-1]